jgi:hypothetical protein
MPKELALKERARRVVRDAWFTALEVGVLHMPFGSLLVGISGAEDSGFVEVCTEDLEPHRQAIDKSAGN